MIVLAPDLWDSELKLVNQGLTFDAIENFVNGMISLVLWTSASDELVPLRIFVAGVFGVIGVGELVPYFHYWMCWWWIIGFLIALLCDWCAHDCVSSKDIHGWVDFIVSIEDGSFWTVCWSICIIIFAGRIWNFCKFDRIDLQWMIDPEIKRVLNIQRAWVG